MYQPGGRRQPEMDFEQVLAQIRNALNPLLRRFGGGGVGLLGIVAILLVAVVWLATGVYQVGPGEQAALRLFGAAQGEPITQEGLHWWWPGPIGKKNVVLVTETRRMELGFRSAGVGSGAISPFPSEALMISGDLNIVDVQMVVQYRIQSLTDFLFRVEVTT